MASIRKNELKDGTSYRILVKVKSPRTGKVETKSMTWKAPKGLSEDQIQKKLKQVANEFDLHSNLLGFSKSYFLFQFFQFLSFWL